MEAKIHHKHPLPIRIFHWLNFFALAIMVWSGLRIYWANDVYSLGMGDFTLFQFFPESFYQALDLDYKLAKGMSFHFSFMWLFILNTLAYLIYLLLSGQYRKLFPRKGSFKNAWKVLLHDLHIRRGLPPQEKYNDAQRIAYTFVLVFSILMILTGFAIYKPVQLHWLRFVAGGYEFARALHFTFTILLCLFFVVHIVQVVMAGWNNFQSMVTGIDLKPDRS